MGQYPSYAYLNELTLNRQSATPLYLQVAQGLAGLIKRGLLAPGQRLPGSRELAARLGVHRTTLALATDELQAEGWVQARARSGLFVSDRLPLRRPEALAPAAIPRELPAGLPVEENLLLDMPEVPDCPLAFDDGTPDPRLSPLRELGREYQRLLRRAGPLALLSYGSPQGDEVFRRELARQLAEARALPVAPEQLVSTRGSLMGIYLLARTLLRPGDAVAVAELSYHTANLCFAQCGADLVRVPLDEQGLDTQALAALLPGRPIRLVYVTSHHQHPTTVVLAAERRLHLYELAKAHGFYILEDDYDFDYHYDNQPTLPIASLDTQGRVLYVGSYSKLLYPGLRVGFVAAPRPVVRELLKYRRIVDRQGDHLLERALGNLLREGVLARYVRKAKRHYRQRKELLCRLLRQELSSYLDFREPEGGLAVWVRFKPAYSLPAIARACRTQGLYLSDGRAYSAPGQAGNACRLGFARLTEAEIEAACGILKAVCAALEAAG